MPVESIKGRGATRNLTPTRFNLKERVADEYSELVYNGLWFTPTREAIDPEAFPDTVAPVSVALAERLGEAKASASGESDSGKDEKKEEEDPNRPP